MNPWRLAAAVALATTVAMLATYIDAWHLGFIWDDYVLLRPTTWAELRRVWHGSWDATGYMPTFYRPLAVWANAAGFQLAGFNDTALTAIAFVELLIGAWLIGLFVGREIGAQRPAMFAAVAFGIHPVVAQSAGLWWFEQNHRLSVVMVAIALLLWQRRRHRLTWTAWWPVHLAVLVGSWFKEDVLCVAPLLLAWQWWRAREARDVPSPTWRFAAQCGAAWAVWLALRWWLLGTFAGQPYGAPVNGVVAHLVHAARGPWLTFVRIRAMSGEVLGPHYVTSAALVLVSVGGLWCWRAGTSARARVLMGQGLAAAACFNLPMAVQSYPTRYHLIAIGAVLFLTGALVAILDTTRARSAVTAASVAVALTLFASTGSTLNFYRPCSPANLGRDQELRDHVAEVPVWSSSWFMAWLDEKARRCEAMRYHPPSVVWPDVLREVREGRRF